MLTKLTPAQEARIPEYYEKWKRIAFSTERIDRKAAEAVLKKLFKGLVEVNKVIYVNSPFEAQQFLREKFNDPAASYAPNYWVTFGNINAGYCAFYDYIIEELLPLDTKTLKLWYTFKTYCSLLQYIWVYPEFVLCSERPVIFKFNSSGAFHCDGGPAIEWADKQGLYFLNGVAVPDWLACTPRHKLDAHCFAKLSNAEVRREFVRKMGAETLMLKLGSEKLDTQGTYELHLLDLGGETGKWPYLKMLNPSIGVWHFEPVAKTCKTVEQALAWRDGETVYQKPDVLT